jgi:hypothetical protein
MQADSMTVQTELCRKGRQVLLRRSEFVLISYSFILSAVRAENIYNYITKKDKTQARSAKFAQCTNNTLLFCASCTLQDTAFHQIISGQGLTFRGNFCIIEEWIIFHNTFSGGLPICL